MPKVSKREVKKAIKCEEEEAMAMPAVIPAATTTSTVHFSAEFAPRRFVVYSRFNEQDWIHVREYVTYGERTYPSKKGVAFTPARLRTLMNKMEEIDEQLKQSNANVSYKVVQASYKTHLGAAIYAAVDSKYHGVDLRRYWLPERQTSIVPTKNGIYLSPSEWASLKEKLNELVAARPELSLAEECFHQNQMGQLDCRECLPFGWMIASFN